MQKNVKSYFQNKNVLITGHTGFKGAWLTILMLELGANVCGYSIDESDEKFVYHSSNIKSRIKNVIGDVADYDTLLRTVIDFQPDFIFHLAAQPLVRLSYEKPVETYMANVIGSINILETLKTLSKSVYTLMITTDKVYKNKEWHWGYRETDELGGYDPYSSSKACAEIAIDSWRNSFFNVKQIDTHKKAIATARAGNVIGGGDFSKDRIVTDSILGLEKDGKIVIRNRYAVRPFQHVLDVLNGYITIMTSLVDNPVKVSDSWNIAPYYDSVVNVETLATKIVHYYGSGKLEFLDNPSAVHEATLLTLDNSKIRNILKWTPLFNIDEAVKFTVDFYKKRHTSDVYELAKSQIKEVLGI